MSSKTSCFHTVHSNMYYLSSGDLALAQMGCQGLPRYGAHVHTCTLGCCGHF